jgi:hypothetical protein
MLNVKIQTTETEVKPGQIRKHCEKHYYGLVITDGQRKFNVVKLTEGVDSSFPKFETIYRSFVSSESIQAVFPYVVAADLTIKDER